MKRLRGLTPRLALLLVLITAVLPTSVRAHPGENAWERYPLPQKGAAGGWVLTSDNITESTGVTAITAAADGTIYAGAEEITGTPLDGYDLFTSTDGGYTWTPLWKIPSGDKPSGGPLSDPDATIIRLVLPRRQDSRTLYLATQYNVYRSTDGGQHFITLGSRPGYGSGSTIISSRLITSLDVAPYHGDYMALVGTQDNDSADYGGLYLYDGSARLPAWTDLQVGGSSAGTEYDVLSAALSPNFTDDQQIVALVTDETETRVTTRFGIADWAATVADGVLSFAATGGALAFPTDYDSAAAGSKYVQYLGLSALANSSVYVLYGAEAPASPTVTALFAASLTLAVHSLAAVGESARPTVIAGLVTGGVIYGTSLETRAASTPPGPATAVNAVVALGGAHPTGEIVYAGTTGVSSAFARSIDSGTTFAQTAFISDDLVSIIDLAVSPGYGNDGTIYLITRGNTGLNRLWRTTDKGQTWEAVLTTGQVITIGLTNLKIVGLIDKVAISPRFATDITVLVADSAGDVIWQSTDNGFSFTTLLRQTGTAGTIAAWQVVEPRQLLVGDSLGNLYRTTDGGKHWRPPVATGLSGFSSLVLSPDYDNDQAILAADDSGQIYLSTDGGESWRSLSDTASGLGSGTLAAFSPDYARDGTLYAADSSTDTGIRRFVRGASTVWQRLDQTNPGRAEEVTTSVSGLQVAADGGALSTLYATQSAPVVSRVTGTTAATGGAARSLNPTASLTVAPDAPLFETVNNGLPAGATMKGLWLARDDGATRLWSYDTTATPDVLYTYLDTLSQPAVPVSPADGTSSGRQTGAEPAWQELTGVTSYQVEYGTSPGLENPTQRYTQTNSLSLTGLESGLAYYWRARAGQSGSSVIVSGTTITYGAPALSRFSATWSFTTGLGGDQWSPAAQPALVAPAAGQTGVSTRPVFQWQPADRATGYELTLARDSDFSDIVVSLSGATALPNTVWTYEGTLDHATTYCWRVRAVSDISHSQWAVGVFTTGPAPSAAAPPAPPSPPAPSPPSTPSTPAATAAIPLYLWAIIGTLGLLLIVVLVLIVTYRPRA
ncbi:MAG: hypothetical protein V1780_06785 [Chloroflexota bacterium]